MSNVVLRSGLVLTALTFLGTGMHMHIAQAASNVYNFTARGTISDFNESDKTIKVDVTKVDGKGKTDLQNNNTQFAVGKARVVKLSNGKDKHVSYHNLAIGQEVAFKGVKKDDDTYVVSFIRISDRSFSVVGLLEKLSRSGQTMTISVVSSTYKPSAYRKGIEINMVFNNDTKFRNQYTSTEVSVGDVNADAQRVKVVGTITSSNTWNVTKLWDQYTASK